MGKLYDKDGNLIPLCYRCWMFEEFPECDAYGMSPFKDTAPMKAGYCTYFSTQEWWKVKNMGFKKPSDLKTFKTPPVRGVQNTLKGTKYGK